jgi:hypothetical protein
LAGDRQFRKSSCQKRSIFAYRRILLIAEYNLEGEWEGRVRYLPLR